MISFNITDVKLFMNKLLKETVFDEFQISNLELTSITKFTVSGNLNKKFLSSDEQEIIGDRNLVTWGEIKPIIFNIIKGNKTPTSLKIVFSLSPDKIKALFNNVNIPSENIDGLFINILFEDHTLKCTTGTSLKLFTLDKTIENYWDTTAKKFFTKHEIPIIND